MKAKIVFKGGKGSGNFGHSGRPGKVGGSGVSAGKGATHHHTVNMPDNAVTSPDGLSKTFSNNWVKGKNPGDKLAKMYLGKGRNQFQDKAVKGKVAQITSGDFKGAFVRIHGATGVKKGDMTFDGSIITGKGREAWSDNLMKFKVSMFN